MGVGERGSCAVWEGEKRLGPRDFTVRSDLPGHYLARSVREAANALPCEFVSLIYDVIFRDMANGLLF